MAKTIVKEWYGDYRDDSKATYKEFKSKKAALAYIKLQRYINKVHGHEMHLAANYYEIFKKE